MMTFGVGCFHFAPKKLINRSIALRDYIQNVEQSLQRIKSISELSITYDQDIDKPDSVYELDKREVVPNIEDGDAVFPYIHYFTLRFMIHIPHRVQIELSQPFGKTLETATEDFAVTIRSTFTHPVTFVECIKPKVLYLQLMRCSL
jgi:hypothetical protein